MAASEHLGGNLPKGRTQAEHDYGTGRRISPPRFHELSPESQATVEKGYQASMSGWRSREQRFIDEDRAGQLSPKVVERLDDRSVSIDQGAQNMAAEWESMMGSANRPDPAWYFGQNRRLTEIADRFGADRTRTMAASASMSPQNDPDSEVRAVTAMTDAVKNKRQVRAKNDIPGVMKAGQRRQISSMTPDEMQTVTSTGHKKDIEVAPDFDVAGFRNAGTNRRGGFETVRNPDHDEVARMETAKVPWYFEATRDSQPDTAVHAEYEARFTDQTAAREVRLGREMDRVRGASGGYAGHDTELYDPENPSMGTVSGGFQASESSRALRGTGDRVDVYGLMDRPDDDTDPLHDHPVLGRRGGVSVPDTWINSIQSGQEYTDKVGSPSPAKKAGSQTASTSSSVEGSTFAGPKEAEELGGKKLTSNTVWAIGADEAISRATRIAGEAEAQTSIPKVMMQEMTWVHRRDKVADSARATLEDPETTNKGKVATRISKLTGGRLDEEKKFRPAEGHREPVSLEHEGMFHRGSDNPLDDSTVTLVPGRGGAAPSSREGGVATTGRNPAMEEFHAAAAGPAPTQLAKRRAIKEGLKAQTAERAARGITASPDPRS